MPFGNQFGATYNTGILAPSGVPSFSAEPALLAGNFGSYGAPSSAPSYAPRTSSNSYPVPGARNVSGTAGAYDQFAYPGNSVVNTTGGGGGGFHVPFLPFGFGSGGSTPSVTDTPWNSNAGQPQPAQPGFLSRLFGGLLGAIPGAFGSVAHLGSLGIGSLLNRGQDPAGAPPAPPPPPPAVSSAGTPSQLASNAQTAFQTGFQNMQSASNPTFYKPDELTAGRGPTPSGPAPGTAAYKAAYPSGSTMADLQAFNSKIAAGSIPTFQQFMGQPAYKPPTVAPPKG